MMLAAMISLVFAGQAGALPPERAALIATARAAVERQDIAGAIATLETARAADPDDPEILRLLGSAYAYAQRYPEAVATLSRAERLAPDDLDIKAALARAYLWSGDRPAASRELAVIEARDPDNADAQQIRTQLNASTSAPGSGRHIGVALSQSVSRVSFRAGPTRTWSSTNLALFGDIAPATTLTLDADREDRQTATDTRLEARIDQRFGSGISGHLAIAGTPHADFREHFSIAGGIEAKVNSALTLLADVRRADYGTVAATAFEPGARLTLHGTGLSATARMINLWDEHGTHRSGVLGRIDKEFRDGATLYVGAATYPDTETGITRQVAAAFVGGALPLSGRLTLRTGLDYERRQSSYTRKGASLGLQFRF